MMNQHLRRRRTIVIVAVVVAVLVVVASAIFTSSKDDAPLPNSTGKVGKDDPLTAAQATEVRNGAHTLTVELVDRIASDGRDVDRDRSYEAWSVCTAKQEDLFEPTYNGIYYHATVFVTTSRPVFTPEIRTLTGDVGVTWNSDDDEKGTRGIYTVEVPGGESLGVNVDSPCYFLRDAGTQGRAEATKNVTGFLRQEWRR